MEALRQQRVAVQRTCTRTFDSLEEQLGLAQPESEAIAGLLIQAEEKARSLGELDGALLKGMQDEKCTQEEYDREFDAAEVYAERGILLRSRGNRLLCRLDNLDRERQREIPEVEQDGPRDQRRKYRLPEIELKKFDGNPKEWLSFWGQFQKIHEDTEIDPVDKFQYLIQATVVHSKARELVESFPPTAANYTKVMEHLRGRFGREETLVEVYVRELLRLVLHNAMHPRARESLAELYDKLETQLRALETLGVTTDKYASMLYPLVESSLPEDSLRAWERNRTALVSDVEGHDGILTQQRLTSLMNFLRGEVEGEERIRMARTGFGIERESAKKSKRPYSEEIRDVPTAAGLLGVQLNTEKRNEVMPCVFCDKGHFSRDCRQALRFSIQDKRKILLKKRCCFTCLKSGHMARTCKSSPRCSLCNKKHYEVMCPGPNNSEENGIMKSSPKDLTLANASCSMGVSLQTLRVRLRGPEQGLIVRALIDSGSQRSYISKRVAALMNYPVISEDHFAHVLFGGKQTQSSCHSRHRIFLSSLKDDFRCNFEAWTQDEICGTVPQVPRGPWLNELEDLGIDLTDIESAGVQVGSREPGYEIDVLIGADVSGKLLTGKIHRLGSGPVAVQTELGWTLLGKTPRDELEHWTETAMVTTLLSREATLTDLWTLDSLGICDPTQNQTREELAAAAMDHFERTVRVDEEGRYEVSLPWIDGHPPLPTNSELSLRRLGTTVKRLKAINRLEAYEKVLKEWIDEGVIEEIQPSEFDKDCHYLPHRAVFKESSSTTKIRPVFDASAHQKGSPSLNHCLEKGPNLIEMIPAILHRFRMHRFGAVADIRRAFLQIGIQARDRDFLRFFWWQGGDPEQLRVYRHKRVVFGVSTSPFLLAATLGHHLQKAPAHLSESSEKLKSSMYVDNCVVSVESEGDLEKFIKQSEELLATACWDLRGWRYNFTGPLKECGPYGISTHELRETELLEETNINVLGLIWDFRKDILRLDLKLPNDRELETVTKRQMLSVTQQVFDPIGFSCPNTLLPKVLLQQAWELKLTWDEKMPEVGATKFKRWVRDLHYLSEVEIPRRMLSGPWQQEGRSLHIFCDASKMAYATCIFIRLETPTGTDVQLVQARSRVAPLKAITIPRLELLACGIGARLANSVKSDIYAEDMPTFYWSDSTNALFWIKNEDQWGTFVWNRVKEIRSLSQTENWRHVPGMENPADLLSRGCTAKVLLQSHWWEGPNWLRQPANQWPKMITLSDDSAISAERKVAVVSYASCVVTNFWSDRYSSYWKILKVIAWIRRFQTNCRSKTERVSGPLTLDEINQAEMKLLRSVQRESFADSGDEKFRSMELVQDEYGILRVKTPVQMRDDTKDFKHPIILPHSHPIVNLLIRWKHTILSHSGVQTLLVQLRERYWILQGRRAVRRVIKQCLRCRRFDTRRLESVPSVLPLDRVRDAAVFEVTGVDLAGPLILKGGQKVWIVLFTCAIYRAVHLELTGSLSTESFVQALRRFVARRGRPSVIYSDNGTNFTGASAALKSLDWQKIETYSKSRQIEWRFNPPSAAWWGGWWERLIGMLKRLLRSVLGRATLNYEEFGTIICDCEAVMNSRPLTYLSEDSEELVPLTPSMFICDQKDTGVPDLDSLDHDGLNRRQRYRQKIRQELRKRFRGEYLAQLRQRRKGNISFSTPAVGDVVMIGSENTKRLDWPLGKVTKLYPGKDGYVRVCRIRTAKSELVRPIQRLYPLEVTDAKTEEIAADPVDEVATVTPRVCENSLKEPREFQEKLRRTRSGRVVRSPQRLGT